MYIDYKVKQAELPFGTMGIKYDNPRTLWTYIGHTTQRQEEYRNETTPTVPARVEHMYEQQRCQCAVLYGKVSVLFVSDRKTMPPCSTGNKRFKY